MEPLKIAQPPVRRISGRRYLGRSQILDRLLQARHLFSLNCLKLARLCWTPQSTKHMISATATKDLLEGMRCEKHYQKTEPNHYWEGRNTWRSGEEKGGRGNIEQNWRKLENARIHRSSHLNRRRHRIRQFFTWKLLLEVNVSGSRGAKT